VLEGAKKLDMGEEMTEGMTDEEVMKAVFGYMGTDRYISWEDFKEQKYFLYSVAKDWEKDVPGFRGFYDDPVKHPLPTPSGKLEFYSERLATHFPDDDERPPSPKWIEKSAMHDERRTSERARVYPLLLMSNHGRWRVHAQCDDISWTREAPTCKVAGPDGYKYEPLWIHPTDAESRGIRQGDVVKVFNELGIVLSGAYVTERIRPGVVYQDHGARVDFIKLGVIDRGGAINTITPHNTTSKNCAGMVTSGFLVECKVADMDGLRRDFPEAFSRPYHYGSEQKFERILEKHP